MATIPVLPASAPSSDVVACLEHAGCVVVRGVTDDAARATLKHELAPHLVTSDAGNRLNKVYEASGGNGSFYPGNTKRITALVAKSETFRSFVMHPLMLSACDALLKPHCASYQVHATAGLVIGPGATVQVLHREEDGFQFFKLPRPNMVLASMWAVSDFSAANGGTHLVPGSHRWDAGRVARDDEVVAAEMPAGSVLLWMGGTLHGAGANRTEDEWRYGVFLSYSLGWLRQEENQYIDTPPEVARTFPKPLRRLVGYGMHASLGYTDVPPQVGAEKKILMEREVSSPADLIDLQRYPILDLHSDAARALTGHCREQLDRTGACELPAFLTPEAVISLTREADDLSALAYHSESTGTPYLEIPDRNLPEDHPRRIFDRTSVGVVAYDQFPSDSTMRRLYEWDPLMEFIGAALNKERLCRYADPFGALNLAVMRDGERLHWHFDQTDFVTSIALRAAEHGGDFDYVPLIRSATDENYLRVQRLLKGAEDEVVRVPMTPGTLLLFEGRNSIHRVTPIRGRITRLVALLAYDTKPGTRSSKLLQRARYGREA